MPTLTYTFPYSINSDLVMTASELREQYLFGIDFRDEFGNAYSDQAIEYSILNAQTEIENYLNIKLRPQVVEESFDYQIRDFMNWGYIRTSYFAREPFSLIGFIAGIRQIIYPEDWLSVRQTNDPIGYQRRVNLVPGGSSGAEFSASATYTALYPFWGYSANEIPQYWTFAYSSGFDVIPRDILSAIGKLATIEILSIMGESSPIGSAIASRSISIDGLSQSISTTASATSSTFGARIKQTSDELLKNDLPKLKDRYRGIGFSAL